MKKQKNDHIYLLSGINESSKQEYVESLKTQILQGDITEFNYNLFYADSTDAKEVITLANTFPFISDKRLIILKRFQSYSAKDKAKFIEYAQSPSDFTYLIICYSDKPAKEAWYKNLAKVSTEKAFWPYKEYEILGIINKKLATKNKRLDREAGMILLDIIGENPTDLDQEVNKLLDYNSESDVITKDDILSLITKGKQDNIFKWAALITDGKYKSALKLLLAFISTETVKYPYLLYMLSDRYIKIFTFNQLIEEGLDIKTAMRNVGVNAYFDKLFPQMARKHTTEHLKKIFDHLIQADQDLKTGKKTHPIIIEQLILNIAKC